MIKKSFAIARNGGDVLRRATLKRYFVRPAKYFLRKLNLYRKSRLNFHYIEENKKRMRYADFRNQGLFVGSGVIEAGCKSIIGARLKQSGMEWTVKGANAIIALRCATALRPLRRLLGIPCRLIPVL